MRTGKSFLKIFISLSTLIAIFPGCSRINEINLERLEPLTSEQSDRVRQALSPLKIPFDTWDVKRARSPVPLAASFKGYLLLSDGIFVRLASISELSFLLAHEFAHKKLAHEIQNKPNVNMEREADKEALFMLIKAGINPAIAITALSRMRGGNQKEDYDLTINDRIEYLSKLIYKHH